MTMNSLPYSIPLRTSTTYFPATSAAEEVPAKPQSYQTSSPIETLTPLSLLNKPMIRYKLVKISLFIYFQSIKIMNIDRAGRRATEVNFKGILTNAERQQISMHSEGFGEHEHESQRVFSFNQSFNNIEQNNKLIQEKTNSLSKIKNLEDQIRSHRTRSSLWDKTKAEILNLNKYLKLSSLSLGCSDAALMKEFFETVTQMIEERDKEVGHEKSQVSEAKKKQQELFQKLVETNKKRYQIEQKMVQYEHQVSKLSEINDSLREKSRVQSTERSSKIKEFHQETILTINQREMEVSNLEQRNDELKRQVIRFQSQVEALLQRMIDKEAEISHKIDENQQLYLENQLLNKKLTQYEQQKNDTEAEIKEIKDYLGTIVDENITMSQELAKRAELITALRTIIQEAKAVNQEYIQQQRSVLHEQEKIKKQKLQKLLTDEASLKESMRANRKFGINRRRRMNSKSQNSIGLKSSLGLLPSEELLI